MQMPELKSVSIKKGEFPVLRLFLQNGGMLLGAAIMLVIALYEVQLQNAIAPSTAHDH